ncbi:MAG: hypothetical protein K2P90_00035 [Holosporales bacterium]|jgi:hypothetical protein|nr:hypothetical protein [Holosporales bacterium]
MDIKQIGLLLFGFSGMMVPPVYGASSGQSCDDLCLDTGIGCIALSEEGCGSEMASCIKACQENRQRNTE